MLKVWLQKSSHGLSWLCDCLLIVTQEVAIHNLPTFWAFFHFSTEAGYVDCVKTCSHTEMDVILFLIVAFAYVIFYFYSTQVHKITFLNIYARLTDMAHSLLFFKWKFLLCLIFSLLLSLLLLLLLILSLFL